MKKPRTTRPKRPGKVYVIGPPNGLPVIACTERRTANKMAAMLSNKSGETYGVIAIRMWNE